MACLSSGLSLFQDCVIPEGVFQRKMLGSYYKEYPIASRVIAAPLAAISGGAKVLLFPVICAVGVVVLPLIAVIQGCRGEEAGKWLGAWSFCVLGVAATLGFLSMATFHVPLVFSLGTFTIILSISITIHVHTLVKEPSGV